MRVLCRIALLVAPALAAMPSVALAQTAGFPRSGAETLLAQEALAFREKVRAAVEAKDRRALEAAYADNFSHLRDSGRVDLKAERIALVLSGESTIETAPEENMNTLVFEPATVGITGVSPIKDPQTGKPVRFRWLTVYVKQADGWKVAISQATRLRPGQR